MLDKKQIENALELLNKELEAKGSLHNNIIVCGGAALIITDLIDRTTKDIDIIGLLLVVDGKTKIIESKPLPISIVESSNRVAIDLKLDKNWLNSGPSDIVKYGLPEGFEKRLIKKKYGEALTVYFVSRLDQIHFKVYAATDTGPGRHLNDLIGLNPTADELESAAKWVKTQDPSEDFRIILKEMLQYLSYGNVAEKI